jgi:hypothetical protein
MIAKIVPRPKRPKTTERTMIRVRSFFSSVFEMLNKGVVFIAGAVLVGEEDENEDVASEDVASEVPFLISLVGVGVG